MVEQDRGRSTVGVGQRQSGNHVVHVGMKYHGVVLGRQGPKVPRAHEQITTGQPNDAAAAGARRGLQRCGHGQGSLPSEEHGGSAFAVCQDPAFGNARVPAGVIGLGEHVQYPLDAGAPRGVRGDGCHVLTAELVQASFQPCPDEQPGVTAHSGVDRHLSTAGNRQWIGCVQSMILERAEHAPLLCQRSAGAG